MEDEEILCSLAKLRKEDPKSFDKSLALFKEFSRTYWDFERRKSTQYLRCGFFFGELKDMRNLYNPSANCSQIVVSISGTSPNVCLNLRIYRR
jgi:hypothetical protein